MSKLRVVTSSMIQTKQLFGLIQGVQTFYKNLNKENK